MAQREGHPFQACIISALEPCRTFSLRWTKSLEHLVNPADDGRTLAERGTTDYVALVRGMLA